MWLRRKDRQLPPAEEIAAAETIRDRLLREMAEIEPPAEMYYIGQDHQNGMWWVDGWRKRLEFSHYGRADVRSGHERLVSLLPSRERAELWLAAHIKPAAARMAYDAGGQPISATPADEALADLKAGRTVSHEAVKGWLESWGTRDELPPPADEVAT